MWTAKQLFDGEQLGLERDPTDVTEDETFLDDEELEDDDEDYDFDEADETEEE